MSQGVVEVHNRDLCWELLGDSDRPLEADFVSSSGDTTTMATDTSDSMQVCPWLPLQSSAIHAVDWLTRKARRVVMTLPDDPELTQLKKICEQISCEEHALLLELDQFLAEEEGHQLSKKAMLFKKWNERVFEPIHEEVVKKMESKDYNMLDSEKRKLFDNYLRYSTKQDVFLDTISRDKYNPDKVTQLKVHTSPLSDPLRAQNDDTRHKDRAVQSSEQGLVSRKTVISSSSSAQRGTKSLLWLAMELVYIDSGNAQARRRGVSVNHNKCSDGNWEGQLRIPHKRKREDFNNHQPLSLQWKE